MIGFLLKLLPVFLLTTVKFVLGVPAAKAQFDFNFFELFIFASVAGITGVGIFMFLGTWLFKGWDALKARFFPPKEHVKKKRFSKRSRFMTKVIKKYGLPGIAFITPTLISIPIGTMLAKRLYKHLPRKVFLYLSISVVFWSLLFAAGFNFKSFFN